MFQVGKIKIRDIKELQDSDVATPKNAYTPLRKRKNLKSATTIKKSKEGDCNNGAVNINNSNIANTVTKTATKRLTKSALKETPFNQKRIDSYFTTCPKTYNIKVHKEETPIVKSKTDKTKTKGNRNASTNKKNKRSPGRPKARRKRLFTDSTEPPTENMSDNSFMKVNKKENNVECIIINSDSEEEHNVEKEIFKSNSKTIEEKPASNSNGNQVLSPDVYKVSSVNSSPITTSSLSFGQQLTKTSCDITAVSVEKSCVSGSGRRRAKPCPPYKVIENTTFAVDAFQFGYIDNVTHYFLTHFHADHYIGLTKSFAMPLFVSPITASLLRAFIPVQEQYIHELELNQSIVINNIEITAVDANHCPGSIMFVFKFLDTGKCVLHTGDFRACHDMESEPIFWNNHIHTIYLDTTYLSDKYAFCTQYESIEKARDLIEKFLTKHCWQRVLYICGAYIIGKEKFWSSLAEEFDMKVWAEGNRKKALKAINDERFNRLLVEDANEANMHILPMGKLSYLELLEYFKLYEHQYDVLFALRPSGWEKDTKPRYGGKINLVGVEYSEHSSYAEMQRFVKFLKPDQVISTVPTGRNLMVTSNVPQKWYKYDKLKFSSNYQTTIDCFLGKTPHRKPSIRLPNTNKGGVEHFVSPLKLCSPNKNNENNNPQVAETTFSINSSVADEGNENIEEVCRGNSPTNVQADKNPAKSKIITLVKSITNSSEDFEKTDFTIKTKNLQSNKNYLKTKGNDETIRKTINKRNKKQLTPKNIRAEDDEINFEELPKTKCIEADMKNKSQLQQTNKVHNSSVKEINNSKTYNMQRITRSQKLTNNSCKIKAYQHVDSSESTSQEKSIIKSINLAKNNEIGLPELELPISQKRVTRSKTASSKERASFLNIQHNDEEEFESKPLKITERNKASKPRSQLKLAQENPILKSTTDSSVDRLSHDAIHSNKINFSTTSDNFLDDFENLPTKSSQNKRHASSHNLTPFKKSKSTFKAQTILNTILEQTEDFDRFKCSQLAGLVVETLNQQNPDKSRDHIPADLLSDADDDWM